MDSPFIDKKKIHENEFSYSFYDTYPVSKGHMLIVPRRIVPEIFDLTKDEYLACLDLVRTGRNHLKSELSQTNDYIQEQIESTNLQDPLQVAELEKNITTAKNTISEKIEHFLSSINNPELTEKLNSITASITPPITTEAIQEKIVSTEDKGSYSLSSGIEL